MSPLVVRQGFFESVLAMEDIPDIILETRDAPRLAHLRKDLPGALRSLEGPVVLSQQNQRLDGTAQRARGFFPDFQGFVQSNGLLVVLDRRAVMATGIERVGPRSQSQRHVFLPAQLSSDRQCRVGQR